MFKNYLIVEEYNLKSIDYIGEQYDTLELKNSIGIEVDELEMKEALLRISGISRIKTLHVLYNSKVKNLLFIEALPELETINLSGRKFITLDGVEWFKKGKSIVIETNNNRKRSIAKIADTKINHLYLQWAKPEDFEVISRCNYINSMTLTKCPRITFSNWQNLPITDMMVVSSAIDNISDTATVATLKRLTLACRNLERFSGDNGMITLMIIMNCHKLDFRTINTFSKIKHLIIHDIKNVIHFSSFKELPLLNTLSFVNCKIDFDLMDLKNTAPDLEKIWIQGTINKDEAKKLSLMNRDVLIRNGVWQFMNGVYSKVAESELMKAIRENYRKVK